LRVKVGYICWRFTRTSSKTIYRIGFGFRMKGKISRICPLKGVKKVLVWAQGILKKAGRFLYTG